MGNTTINDYVPFNINYKFNNDKNAFHSETKNCSEAYPVNIDFLFKFQLRNISYFHIIMNRVQHLVLV